MSNIVMTRPEHDMGTLYLSKWSKKLKQLAENKGFDIIDLEQEKSEKKQFESYVSSQEPDIVLINGHGTDKLVAGHEDEPMLIEGENHGVMSGKVYARSCKSGKSLGKTCVEDSDAEAYIGYESDFVLIRDNRTGSNPQNDKYAKPILKASNEVPKAFIEGKSGQEAYERSQERYKQMMEKAVTNYSLDNNQVYNALAHNRENQILHE